MDKQSKKLQFYDPANAANVLSALPEKLAILESLKGIETRLHDIAEQAFRHPATKYYSLYMVMLEQHCRLVRGDIDRDIYGEQNNLLTKSAT